MKRLITIKLTRAEADALIDIGNLGIADAHDSQDDETLDQADIAEAVLHRDGTMTLTGIAPLRLARS